jgi:hypothetical protein
MGEYAEGGRGCFGAFGVPNIINNPLLPNAP